MSTVTVDTKAIDGLIKKLSRVGEVFFIKGSISPLFKQVLNELGDKILKTVKEETPISDDTKPDYHENSEFHKDKTSLRDSWKWKLSIKGAIVEGYAFLEEDKLNDLADLLQAGSPRHEISAKPGSVLRFYVKKGGNWEKVYTKKVLNHPGFQANRFIDRSQEKTDTLIKELSPIVQSSINRIILGT